MDTFWPYRSGPDEIPAAASGRSSAAEQRADDREGAQVRQPQVRAGISQTLRWCRLGDWYKNIAYNEQKMNFCIPLQNGATFGR